MQAPFENVLQAVKQYFTHHPDEHLCKVNNNTFVRVPFINKEEGSSTSYRYYRIALDELLGQGGYAEVYKCYRIDLKTSEQEPKPFAVKIQDKSSYNPLEAQILKEFYFAETPVCNKTHWFLVHQFFEGKVLAQEYGLNPEFDKITLVQALQIICQASAFINRLHNITSLRKTLVGHGDIKGYNVLVDIQPVEGQGEVVTVYLIDFNLSLKIDPQNPVATFDGGSAVLRAPELAQDRFTVSCDIYAFTQLCLIVLGVKNPFTKKSKALSGSDFNARPFSFTNLMARFENELADLSAPLKKYITAFLHRMQSKVVALRPTSDELLRFFTSVLQYVLTFKSTPEISDTLIRHNATMALLASNLWAFCEPNFTINQAREIITAYQTENLSLLTLKSILPDALILPDNLKAFTQNQVKQLTVNNYPQEVYTALERVIDLQEDNLMEITNRLHKLVSFNHIQISQFKLLLQFTAQYVPFCYRTLEILIDHPTPLAALHYCVQHYCQHVLQPLAARSVGYLAWLSGSNPAQELAAARKFLEQCNLKTNSYPDLQNSFDAQEQKVIYKGTVGTILNAHNDLLERFFEEQPEVYKAVPGYQP